MDKKGPFTIRDLKALSPGQQVWGKYLITELTHRKTKDGKDFSNIKIADKTGELDVIAWENCQWSRNTSRGAVVGLLGDLLLFNNRLQITAKRIKELDEKAIAYQKSPETAMEILEGEFEECLLAIKDPYLRELMQVIFTSERKTMFFNAPAAKKIHHNYAGGLLEHTINLVRICKRVGPIYRELNQDLLVVGALMHDVGKLEELSLDITPDYTVEGRLLGHIMLGVEILNEGIKALRKNGVEFPRDLELVLRHMILSHHGLLEFGSPVKPMTPEAFFLYSIDNLDAKMFVFFNSITEDQENSGLFTPYDNLHQQNYYKYRYEYNEGQDKDQLKE